MVLKKYNEKRNFKNTSEPKGEITKNKSKKKIFVIQYHQARAKHFDFRLEHNGVLVSFAIPKGLSFNPKVKRLAVHVEDHPLEYARFEGVIPKGNYGAGVVEIFDKGFYEIEENFEKSFKKGHLKFTLNGDKFKGEWSLIKTDDKNWIIIKTNDKYAKTKELEIHSNKNPFKACSPQLALLTSKTPTGKNWIFEIKYDGYRIISFIENNNAKLLSRNGNDYSDKFKDIKTSLLKMAKDIPMVLDGEVVVFDEKGRSDFGLLQQGIKAKKSNFTYVVFDVLAHNGKDLRNEKLEKRKELLEKITENCPNNIILSSFVVAKGTQSFNLAKKLNLEGIVAKDINSTYNQNRDGSWLKIKCYKRQEFVIGGYTISENNTELSAILVGYYNKNNLIYVGKVGSGFSESNRQELLKLFNILKQKESPFKNYEILKNTTYLKPQVVAEIQFTELTKQGILRQPVFVGVRKDKDAKDVVLETNNEDN